MFKAPVIMCFDKDHSNLTPDELVTEEKKLTGQKIPTALFIGFLVGIACWWASHKGGFLFTCGLLGVALYLGSRQSKKMKSIRAEIGRRDTLR